MTKKKRFKVDYDITVGNYCLHDECKEKGVDGYIAYLSDEERANNLCDLLNEQEERIQELENELKDYSDANAELEQRIQEYERSKK